MSPEPEPSIPGRGPRRRMHLPWIMGMVLLLLGTGSAAYAFWGSVSSSNYAAANADAVTPGTKPTVTANGTALAVSWPAGTTAAGQPATGYTVTRYATATGGTGIPATGACAGTVTALNCTEQNVQGGIWYYTVTPAIALWKGAEGPRSNGVSNDPTAPVASVASISPTPNLGGWNNTSPVTVTVTADDGAAGSGVSSVTYTVDGGAQQTVGGAVATIPVSGDGTHTVSFSATDKAGNAASAKTQTVWIDRAAPGAPGFSSVPTYVNSANVAAVPITGTSEAGAKITLTASDAGAAHSVTATPAPTASGTGNWSASLDLSSLNPGTITYKATATDAADNTSPGTTVTNTKDTAAPLPAQGLVVPAYINVSNASTVPVSGSAETGATVTVTASDSGAPHTVTGTAASGTGTWSLTLDLRTLNQGTVTYTVTVKDAAGNTSTPVIPIPTSSKDTLAPALTISAPAYVNNNTKFIAPVSGNTEAGTIVNVTVRDAALNSVTKQATTSGTSWSTTMDLSTLGEGALTYTAATADAAGNSTTTTATGPNTKDILAPALAANAAIKLQDNNGVGVAALGDTISIEYSEQMDASKFCASWSNNGSAQTLGGNNDITVTISTANVLTVTSATCTLNIGSIPLGGNAKYASTTALTFSGNGNNASSVSWNGSKILTMRLGKAASGTSGTTTVKDAPSYTPAPGLTDLAGNPLGTTTVGTNFASMF
ncbi:hypothetical protein JOE40_000771 [Arthrobacter sp. PvP102]|uniref:Ig-like domain-containing protein n=1 Tax=unclassified Arthrobacter TaxID=235627 RepID=UPI001AE91808|nr:MULTISPECIES: Ig-like domain-containing protein [unclassified Arthrobacter]MBP1235303.1 hypothetical protein [Arthrobacter sp. PvP103]MBP1236262.1 hypothetical protein [Arthrobacter sp. PvP102]